MPKVQSISMIWTVRSPTTRALLITKASWPMCSSHASWPSAWREQEWRLTPYIPVWCKRSLCDTWSLPIPLSDGWFRPEIILNLFLFDFLLFSCSILFRPLFHLFFKTPKSGAQTSLFAALDPDLEHVSGLYFSDCKPKEVSDAAKDDNSAKRLWEESEKWTNLQKVD